MIIAVVVLGMAVVAVLGWIFWAYSRAVTLPNQLHEAWSAVDVQLKKRQNLVPAVVERVKGYRDHEEEVFLRMVEHLAESESGVVGALAGAISASSSVSGSSSGGGGGGL